MEDFIKDKPSIDEIKRKMDYLLVNLIKVDQQIISSYSRRDSIMNIDSNKVKEDFKTFLESSKEILEN